MSSETFEALLHLALAEYRSVSAQAAVEIMRSLAQRAAAAKAAQVSADVEAEALAEAAADVEAADWVSAD